MEVVDPGESKANVATDSVGTSCGSRNVWPLLSVKRALLHSAGI